LTDAGQISAQSLFAGDSGNVVLTASGNIQIGDGFVIAANTFGSGDSGNVDVAAGKSINIFGIASGIASQTVPPPQSELDAFAGLILGPGATFSDLAVELGLAPDADLFAVLGALNDFGLTAIPDLLVGDGGDILVNTPLLTVSGRDSAIDSSTAWDGNAGGVQLNVGSLNITDGAQIRSRSGLVNLVTGDLFVGAGNAGAIEVEATDTISVSGTDSTISTTTFGEGNGGTIDLSANEIDILNGGSVTADSVSTGFTGDITIAAGNSIDMNGGAVSTRALTSDGGNIAMTAPDQVYLLDSEITTSVESGFGGGGNIDIDPDFVILNNSEILANAFGGPGGNINIVAGNFIISADSRVDASSALGLDGTVNISSPDAEVAEDLAVLPENYLDVTSLMSERCGTTAGTSSLVDAGPGGLAVDPDGYLPSFATETNQEDETRGRSRSVSSGTRWWALDTDQPALQFAQVTCTR
jgi:large exoprotein involved in heme utilization and adhesion